MTTPRDAIAGKEPTQEQIAACERAMDGLDAQADIWAEEVALVNIIKNIGDVSRGLKDRMPADVRDGFINRQEAQIDALTRQAYSEGFYRGGESRKEYDAAQNATQLDALSARVKELEAEKASLFKSYHLAVTSRLEWRNHATSAEQERDTLSRVMEDTARELGCASDNEAILEAIARLRQQRDEAYERAAGVATVQAKQGATAEQIGSAIRRLAAGTEKEKRE